MFIKNLIKRSLYITVNVTNIYIVMKSHEDGSDDDDEFMHACIIIIFLLIRLLYSLIHLINCLFQSIQFYSVFINFINLAAVFSLTAYCTQNHLSI